MLFVLICVLKKELKAGHAKERGTQRGWEREREAGREKAEREREGERRHFPLQVNREWSVVKRDGLARAPLHHRELHQARERQQGTVGLVVGESQQGTVALEVGEWQQGRVISG